LFNKIWKLKNDFVYVYYSSFLFIEFVTIQIG
jgi:hypothetical protein